MKSTAQVQNPAQTHRSAYEAGVLQVLREGQRAQVHGRVLQAHSAVDRQRCGRQLHGVLHRLLAQAGRQASLQGTSGLLHEQLTVSCALCCQRIDDVLLTCCRIFSCCSLEVIDPAGVLAGGASSASHSSTTWLRLAIAAHGGVRPAQARPCLSSVLL